MTQVTINGNTYSSAGESAKDMRNGGFRQHLLPMINDVVIVAKQVQLNANNASNAVSSANDAANAAAASAALATEIALGATFPNIRPNLLLDFANSQQVDPRITFTRNSIATRINQNGLLEIVPAHMPRIDYDPITHECLGLLVEEQRTNACLHNRDLSNAVWTKSNCTAAQTQIGIDGNSNNASLLTATGNNATCLQAITMANSDRYQTAYIKRASGSGPVFMTMDNGTTWTNITAEINSAKFVRCSMPKQTLSNPVVGFKLSTAGDAIVVDYVQNENGQFPTSAILTSSVLATRLGDIASLEDFDFSSWYRQDQGTFVVDFEWLFNTGPKGFSCRLIEANNGTSNEFMAITSMVGSATQPIRVFIFSGTMQMDSSYAADFGKLKACIAYKKDDAQLAINGSAFVPSASLDLPEPDRLYIGRQYGNGNHGSFHLSRLAYYPKRLTESELAGLSTL